MNPFRNLLALTLVGACFNSNAIGEDWPRFRGPDGAGVGQSSVPTEWSDKTNVAWTAELPGKGSSSPIVVGDRVFVTTYRGEPGNMQRHVVCVNRSKGDVAWSKAIDAASPEDANRGYLTEHGYASNTPVSDGKQLFVFLGKSGVYAFDLDGKQLWHTDVGKQSSNRRWGSAASLTLYKDTVIVNASEESSSIYALDKASGDVVWKSEAAALELAYGTPSMVSLKDGRQELVIGVAGEVWGMNPENGKLRWYAETTLTGNICPSIVVGKDDSLFVFGGYRSSGSYSIRAGGKGDVGSSHVNWSTRNSSYVATPLLLDGHLCWVDDRGQAFCVNAKNGELVYRERLRGLESGGRPVYASPILAGGKIYVVSRWSGTYVFDASPEFKQLAQNRLEADKSAFNATPAISNGALFMRSDQALYCIKEKVE